MAKAAPGRLTPGPLLAYAALALPLAALNLPLYVYLPTYYSSGLGLDLAVVGGVLLAARLADMLTDPLIGELADRTRTRLGQRRPWIAAAAPLLLLGTWQLFVPPAGAGWAHLLVWSIVAYLAWTMLLLAYQAWGAELSADYHERSRIAGAREMFVILGIVTAAALPTLIGAEPGSAATLAAIFWLMAVGLLLAGGIALVVVGEPEPAPPGRLGLRRGLEALRENGPFRRLLAAYLLNGIANGLPATLFLMFATYVLRAADAAGWLLLVYFLSGLVAVPGWLWLSRRIGKHRAWSASMLWASAGFAVTPLLGAGDVAAFALVCIVTGLSLGADLALPSAMQADVVDLDRAIGGARRTGLFMAFWSMATKLALALAVGIAFPVLDLAGFTATGQNSAVALGTLAALYALLPVPIKLAAALILRGYDLDAARQAGLRATIATRAAAG